MIGPSASGKSTLGAFAGGRVADQAAKVRAWTAPTSSSGTKTNWGPWIGYLPQDIELFEGTVAENIARFGKVDSEQVISAQRSRRCTT